MEEQTETQDVMPNIIDYAVLGFVIMVIAIMFIIGTPTAIDLIMQLADS